MKWHKKFIPTKYVTNIYEINYDELHKQGIKALFFDLDNTIIPYDIEQIQKQEIDFLHSLESKFKIVIVSNSRLKRVSTATQNLNLPFVKFARKPLKVGFKKALKIVNLKPHEVAIIGDQLMTDIYGGNKMKFAETIFVQPIKKKSDTFTTRINRKLEKKVINKIKKKDFQKYEEVLKQYAEEN